MYEYQLYHLTTFYRKLSDVISSIHIVTANLYFRTFEEIVININLFSHRVHSWSIDEKFTSFAPVHTLIDNYKSITETEIYHQSVR